MKLIEMLQRDAEDSYGLRVTNYYKHRWLVFNQVKKLWVVYERKPYARYTTVIIETVDEELAVKYLINRR